MFVKKRKTCIKCTRFPFLHDKWVKDDQKWDTGTKCLGGNYGNLRFRRKYNLTRGSIEAAACGCSGINSKENNSGGVLL